MISTLMTTFGGGGLYFTDDPSQVYEGGKRPGTLLKARYRVTVIYNGLRILVPLA